MGSVSRMGLGWVALLNKMVGGLGKGLVNRGVRLGWASEQGGGWGCC